MIHGKFFTGLPPKMMDKPAGPNRQKSNLFWPDESDIESATESKSKRKQQIDRQTSADSDSSNVPEIEPSKLFREQLKSKIEFYDMEDNSNCPPKINNSCEKQKNLDNFSSKIEFYDNTDNVNQNLPKTNINSKKDVERNTKNSPKTVEKRIKFIDISLENKEVCTPKSILRNNETALRQKSSQDQIRKKLIKKRNLSKSVENLSTKSKDLSDSEGEDCINVIENDVKNITINEEKGANQSSWRNHSKHEQSYFYETFNNNHKDYSKMDRTQRHRNDNHEDVWDIPEQIDENFYRKSGRNETQVIYHDSSSDHGSYLPKETQRISVLNEPTQRNRINMEYDQDRNHDYGNGNQIRDKKCVNQQSSPSKWSNQSSFENNSVNISPHRHLVSSITFGSDNEVSTERPSKNVRSSAVSRVTVGLPD